MLKATPTSFVSKDFDIFDDSEQIAVLSLSWFRERGQLEIGGRSFDIGREGLANGTFFLERNGERLVEAIKPSMFRRRFEITFAGKQYQLQASAPISRTFDLLDGNRFIGQIKPKSIFSRTAIVDLPEDLPVEVRVFMTWLVLVLWKRAQQAAS